MRLVIHSMLLKLKIVLVKNLIPTNQVLFHPIIVITESIKVFLLINIFSLGLVKGNINMLEKIIHILEKLYLNPRLMGQRKL